MSKDHPRPYTHTRKKLGTSWRKPKGLHSKRRLQHSGHAGLVKIGRRTKKEDRHTYQGLEVVTVTSVEDLQNIDENQAVHIPSMGRRKKTPIVKEAIANDIIIVNLDASTYVSKTDSILQQKAQNQKQKEERTLEETVEEESENAEDVEEDAEDQDASTIPTSNNTVKEIKAWLDENDIEYTSSMLKADLLELVEDNS